MTVSDLTPSPNAVSASFWHRQLRRFISGSEGHATQFVWFIGILLIIFYIIAYLAYPELPGNDQGHPAGWWGWFDQSVTLRSTAALSQINLDPLQHHYALGYSVLGVPFYWLMPNHPFFFVDLLSLLGAFAGFIDFGQRMGLSRWALAAWFAFATLGNHTLFLQWVIPWNTAPVGGFAWLLLAQVAAWIDGERRPVLIGVLFAAIIACRPSDGVIVCPCLMTLAWVERRAWRRQLRPIALVLVGGAAVILPIAALHVAIYGFAPSPYMISSRRIGFTLYDFGWKAYVLLIDPYPWFADGEGLLQHMQWLALGLAGLLPALLRDLKARMLAVVLVVHAVLYISYIDLLPTGLWRFLNIHYFAWAIPGYALLAALLMHDLSARRRMPWTRPVCVVSLLATVFVLSLRVVPVRVREDQAAKAVDFTGPVAPFIDTFLGGRLALRDAKGILQDGIDIRGFIYPNGVRVIGMRRDMIGPVEFLPGQAPLGYEGSVPSARWAPSVRLRWPPTWLWQAPPSGIPVPVS